MAAAPVAAIDEKLSPFDVRERQGRAAPLADALDVVAVVPVPGAIRAGPAGELGNVVTVENTAPQRVLGHLPALDIEAVHHGLEFGEAREVTVAFGGRSAVLDGRDYLLGLALPNFYFHSTAAYAILRHLGFDVGKLDYLGRRP